MRIGCFPGSFNPPTLAHLALAEAARDACGLDRIDLVVSRVALGKPAVEVPSLDDRVEVLRRVAAARSAWLGVVVTDHQLLVDIAGGYDVLVLGLDKWAQVMDPTFYGGSAEARDAAVAALPHLALAPRPGTAVDAPAGAVTVELAPHLAEVSSTGVRRDGRRHWMAPEAEAFDAETGAWSDPGRYQRLRAGLRG